MEKLKTWILVAVHIVVLAGQIQGQTILNRDTPHRNRAYLRAGIDPASMLTFGYERNCDTWFLKGKLTSYTEWSTSAFRLAWKNSELKSGVVFPLLGENSFMIVNNINISAGSISTHNFDSKKFAAAIEMAAGLYKKSWFMAATSEYEKICLNDIENTDFYRVTYYEDARDGWYKGAGGMVQFGLEGGISLQSRYDIHLEIKKPFTEQFNSYGGSPLHVRLGFGYRF